MHESLHVLDLLVVYDFSIHHLVEIIVAIHCE